jgi:dienelactone hydrolase
VLALLLLAEPSAGQAVGYYPHLVSANAPDPDQVYRYMPEVEQWRVPALPMVGEKDHQLSRELVIRAAERLQQRGIDVEGEEIGRECDVAFGREALANASRLGPGPASVWRTSTPGSGAEPPGS